MANTTIQLKFSTTTATPTSLNVAEPAYSYTSNTLFIGSPAGTGSIAIGGKFYLDQQQIIFDRGNSAFAGANSAGSYANAAFAAANTAAASTGAFAQANAAFNTANAAFTVANNAFTSANGAIVFNTANAAFLAANAANATDATQNNSITAAFNTANAAFTAANAATATDTTQNNSIAAAFTRANNSINANTGGTIAGDLSITGNLSVSGNVVSISTSQIVANDSLIILAAGNYTADILDIGFAGHYNDGANAHTGFIRDAGTKEYQLFEGYTQEIGANNNININDASFRLATLRANLKSTTVTIKGIDLLPYVNNAYTQANTGVANALAASSAANAAFAVANAATTTNTTQNNSITAAFAAANSAGSYANSAFIAANSATAIDTTQNNSITAAFAHANASFLVANGAAFVANTDFTGLSITAANYGTASAVASFRVEANGRISSANNTSIAIDAAAITSGTLGVPRGGSGAGTFTNNGVLLGQGTSAFATASSSTEGHVLTINASGVPTFSHLQGGTF